MMRDAKTCKAAFCRLFAQYETYDGVSYDGLYEGVSACLHNGTHQFLLQQSSLWFSDPSVINKLQVL